MVPWHTVQHSSRRMAIRKNGLLFFFTVEI
jgi:hypothetical protein